MNLGLLRHGLLATASAALLVLTAFSGLEACSSSTSTPATSPDGSVAVPTDGSTGGDSASPADAAVADAAEVENDCTTYVDRTADTAARTIVWNLGIPTLPERCMKIKAGQTVTWVNEVDAGAADFDTHPLIIYRHDHATTPAVPTADTATGKATFANATLYGFACGIHPTMKGAILVE